VRNSTVEVANLCRFYADVHALNNVSFNVEKGEIFGLLGPNGAGKTTLMRILATLLLPSSGNALIEGLDVVREAVKVRSIIGVYLAEAGFYYRLKVRDFLYFFGRLYGLSRTEMKSRVKELLDFFQLEEKADEEINVLSHGMRRKLQLARALLHSPSVLLLDEPTIGLDPLSAKDLRNKLRELSKEGTTILFSTHYMPEAEEFCNRVLFLNAGRVIAVDSPSSLINKYGGFQVVEVLYNQEKLNITSKHLKSSLLNKLNEEKVDSVRILNGGRLKVYTKNADEILVGIVDALQKCKVQVRSVSITKPTLEDVYSVMITENEGER